MWFSHAQSLRNSNWTSCIAFLHLQQPPCILQTRAGTKICAFTIAPVKFVALGASLTFMVQHFSTYWARLQALWTLSSVFLHTHSSQQTPTVNLTRVYYSMKKYSINTGRAASGCPSYYCQYRPFTARRALLLERSHQVPSDALFDESRTTAFICRPS